MNAFEVIYDWLQHIEFKYPWVLPFLLVVPLVVFYYYRSRRKRSSMTVSTLSHFKIKTVRSRLVHLPFWLRMIALACLILALARPQTRDVTTRTKGDGIDIMLCMDVSGSMLFRDFEPNRLEASKQMAIEFVKGRSVDAIGLVIFSGEAYTLFPLSTDYQGLITQINGLRSGMLADGTLIGEGLATAVERLQASKGKSKVVILLTDGNEQAPETRIIDPNTALNITRSQGVKVYTIGMGAPGVATSDQRQLRANNAYLDENLLKRIAAATGGAYFRALNRESLQDIYQVINRLEKSEVQVERRTRFGDQFVYLILTALALLLLDLLLSYTYFRTLP